MAKSTTYRGARWPKQLLENIDSQAKTENRTFSNMVITICQKHFIDNPIKK